MSESRRHYTAHSLHLKNQTVLYPGHCLCGFFPQEDANGIPLKYISGP